MSCLSSELEDPIWETKIEWKNVGAPSDLSKIFASSLLNQKIECIGHRIVHGGEKYQQSALIDSALKEEMKRLSDLAPLHNLEELQVIEILEQLFPKIPQIAVFDTAFHRTIPLDAKIYPGPYAWAQMGIVRFGFHGISFKYCLRKTAILLNYVPEKVIICHLGSGASVCAIKNGASVDTSMGFTPLEGVMMDTRSGSVDPGILLYLLKHKGRTVETLSRELYEESGLLGLSGKSSDMRDILEMGRNGDERSLLAIDVYVHRLSSMIGSMVVSLGGLDVLVFTAGIGENSCLIREKVCDRLSFLRVSLDPQKKDEGILSSPDSLVKVLMIRTQEGIEIARECLSKFEDGTLTCDQ
jgi:acetate kinase